MVVPLDIDTLIQETYSTDVYGDTAGVLDITLNIVPEPSTALLLMIGLGELSACNRRTRV